MRTGTAFLCLLLLVWVGGCARSATRSSLSVANVGAPADITGRWIVTISLDGETVTGLALLTQTGDNVTGSIGPDERNQHPLDGVVNGERITLTTRPRPGRNVAFDRCYLTLYDGTMRGTTERQGSSARGTIEFVKSDRSGS